MSASDPLHEIFTVVVIKNRRVPTRLSIAKAKLFSTIGVLSAADANFLEANKSEVAEQLLGVLGRTFSPDVDRTRPHNPDDCKLN